MSVTSWGARLTVPVTPGRDHIRGLVEAPVSLVEYGDFECPFCAEAHTVVEAVRDQMGDEMQFVYRHFPITTAHPHARAAAEASEAAAAQGAFWPMHDLLFQDQRRLALPDLLAKAEALGLDLVRFEADLLGRVYADRVQDDFLSGVRSGVNGTPSFFINGIRHDGPTNFRGLLAAVELARR
jgi:protein-disulfide isomerase